MTKNEFIQEAALRLLTTRPDATMGQIADWATDLAGEFFHEQEQPSEKEMLTAFPDDDKVQVVAKERARLEKEAIDRKNAEYKEKGWFCHYQKSGADIRFLNVCYDTSRGQNRIETVKDIIDCGSRNFERRRNMGHLTMDFLDKALENLYNIKSW